MNSFYKLIKTVEYSTVFLLQYMSKSNDNQSDKD